MEDPDDNGGDNSYNVTVTASDGSNASQDSMQVVTIKVVNLEERGTVTCPRGSRRWVMR